MISVIAEAILVVMPKLSITQFVGDAHQHSRRSPPREIPLIRHYPKLDDVVNFCCQTTIVVANRDQRNRNQLHLILVLDKYSPVV